MKLIFDSLFQSFGDADISGEELHDILKEIDTNMNGQVELDEYLQVRGETFGCTRLIVLPFNLFR